MARGKVRIASSRIRPMLGLMSIALFLVLISLEAAPVFAAGANGGHGPSVVPFVPAIDKLVKVGKGPYGVLYNPSNTNLYVPNNASGTVSVISGSGVTKNTVIATVKVGKQPQGIAYDPASSEVYVANFASATVSVLSGTTVVKTVKVMPKPQFIFYSASNGNMYVTNFTSFSSVTFTFTPSVVYAINSGTFAVTKISLGIPVFPLLTYDPANGAFYTTSFSYSIAAPKLVEISSSNVVTKIAEPAGTIPIVSGYSPASTDLYVSRINSSKSIPQSMVALTSSNAVAATFPRLGAFVGVYSPANHDMYFANYTGATYFTGPDKLVVISSANAVVKALKIGIEPISFAYNPTNTDLYISNLESNSTSVISSSNSIVATIKNPFMPIVAIYNPGDTDVFVVSNPKNETSTASSVQVLSSASTPTVLAKLKIGKNPTGVALDASTNEIYISNGFSNTVSVLSS